MLFDKTWAVPHTVSIAIAIGFLVTAIYKPLIARKLYAALFSYATLVNASVALYAPKSYLGNARYALFEGLRDFILGWFSQHIGLVVGGISLAQAAITAGLIVGGVWARAALVAAVVFLVAIAPLGVASAFPSSLIWAAGAIYMLANREARASLEQSLPRLYQRRSWA